LFWVQAVDEPSPFHSERATGSAAARATGSAAERATGSAAARRGTPKDGTSMVHHSGTPSMCISMVYQHGVRVWCTDKLGAKRAFRAWLRASNHRATEPPSCLSATAVKAWNGDDDGARLNPKN
jgi:hypothetical protein